MADFSVFASAVRKRFNDMSDKRLYVVDADRDLIWTTYLDAFPPGSNPVMRVRTEHDCACCRAFIRSIGPVVTIENGALSSIWDLNGIPSPYQEVADAMAAYVKRLPIRDAFVTNHADHGTPSSYERTDDGVRTWQHFAAGVPSAFVTGRPDERRGEYRTQVQVFLRGINEIKPEAIATILDLINDNAIYRGQEFKAAVHEFQNAQARLLDLDAGHRELHAWTSINQGYARFRNTVIGTLAQDLSDGMDLDAAVRSFESKVAPQNYKRPTAIITKGMIDHAMKTIDELGLEQALERRHARLSDISVNSVLFVDNSVRPLMKDGLRDKLMTEVRTPPFVPAKAEEIGIDAFIADVLPKVTGLHLHLDNGMLGNFVSLTAGVHTNAEPLFRWGNDLAWSYDGNVADSLRQRVADLGGRVDGALRFSHTWNYDRDRPNQSLMDLHVFMPGNEHAGSGRDRYGEFYGAGRRVGWNRRNDHESGGVQDVDHVQPPGSFVPVENIAFPDIRRMPEGKYIFKIHNWRLREPTRSGFKAEIEFGGQTFTYEHSAPMKNKEWVTLAEVTLRKGVFDIKHVHESSASSQEKWGLHTLNLVRVNSIILSPNHWEADTGNKHWFFILDGCRNPDPVRGIYNEFLHPRLEKHRKVFEVLGDKTKCPPTDDQLSGVGFSSTKKDRVSVIAAGPRLNKAYTVVFGKD